MQKSGTVGNLEEIFNKFRLYNISDILTVLLWKINNLNSAK